MFRPIVDWDDVDARQIIAEIARVTRRRSAVFAGPVENVKIQI